jgi:pectin methylesterase-like acyl-CoA thioesterase
MKIMISIIVIIGLSMMVVAQSQDRSSQQGQATQTSSDTKGKNMSGTVSHDAKSFKSDADSKKYKVDNPQALSGKEDQHVAVLVAVDPDTNTIHIMQLVPPQ